MKKDGQSKEQLDGQITIGAAQKTTKEKQKIHPNDGWTTSGILSLAGYKCHNTRKCCRNQVGQHTVVGEYDLINDDKVDILKKCMYLTK